MLTSSARQLMILLSAPPSLADPFVEGEDLLGSQHKDQLIVGTDTTRPPLIQLHGSGRDEQDMVPHAAELSSRSTAIAVRGGKVPIPLPVRNRIASGGSASPLNQATSKSIRRLFACFLPGTDVAASSAMH
jgi:hypothetical protein